MSTQLTIVPPSTLADTITAEVEALSLEIFCTTYGYDWQQAITEALVTVTDLATFASDWDDAACVAGNLDACPF